MRKGRVIKAKPKKKPGPEAYIQVRIPRMLHDKLARKCLDTRTSFQDQGTAMFAAWLEGRIKTASPESVQASEITDTISTRESTGAAGGDVMESTFSRMFAQFLSEERFLRALVTAVLAVAGDGGLFPGQEKNEGANTNNPQFWEENLERLRSRHQRILQGSDGSDNGVQDVRSA